MDYQALKILTAATVEPVTVAEVKIQLRETGTSFDTMIGTFITAARESIEGILGRTFTHTTYQLFYNEFPKVIELPMPPYKSPVTHIKYIDTDGAQQTLSSALYQTDLVSEPGRIIPAYSKTWPSTRNDLNAVEIQYIAGYGAAATDIPQPIRQLVTGIAVDLFEHPELNIELRISDNPTYKFLASRYKISVVY